VVWVAVVIGVESGKAFSDSAVATRPFQQLARGPQSQSLRRDTGGSGAAHRSTVVPMAIYRGLQEAAP